MIRLISVFLLIGIQVTEAASGEASIKDLLYPVLNFSVFAALIIWKATGPIKRAFEANAKKITELFSIAEKKDKEAEIKYAEYQKKIGEVETECDKILNISDEDGKVYAQNQEKETQAKIARYTKDANIKVMTEKEIAIREVNESLLNDVIAQTKQQLQKNPEQRGKATSKLMSNI